MNAAFVAMTTPSVETVAVENDALVFTPSSGATRIPLSPTAALIWACLDGESTIGEISADLAEGLDAPFETVLADVIAAVTTFVELEVAYDARQPPPPQSTPRFTPSLTRDDDFPLGDAGRLAVRVGNDVVGIRCNESELIDDLRAAFGTTVTISDDAPPRVSLLATASRGRVGGMQYLYLDDTLVYRSSSRERTVRATVAQVGRLAPAPAGCVTLNAHVLTGKRGAILVGGAFREILDLAERRLAWMGLTTAEAVRAVVDRTTFDAIDGEMRYPITKVIIVGSEPDPAKVASASQRIAGLFPLLIGLGKPVDAGDVEWLWDLARRVDVQWVFGADDQELLNALARLKGRMPRPPTPLPR